MSDTVTPLDCSRFIDTGKQEHVHEIKGCRDVRVTNRTFMDYRLG